MKWPLSMPAYGEGHGRNFVILMLRMSFVTGVAWVFWYAAEAALGDDWWIAAVLAGVGWLVGLMWTLWNFPGAQEYNDLV